MPSKSSRNNTFLGVLMALTAGCSFGIGGAVSQVVASNGFTTMQICVAQFVFGFLVLGALTFFKFRPTIPARDMLLLVALGTVSSISSFTYYLAINLTSVSAAVAIQFQYVWIAVLIQSVFERKLPGKWTVLSAVLIIVGTLFGSGIVDEFMAGGLRMNPLGLLSAFTCAIFYAIFIFFSGKIAPNEHPVTKSFFSCIGGLILVTVITVARGELFSLDVVGIVPWSAVMGLLMAIAPTLCIVAANNKIPGGLVAILTSSELPMAVLAGAVILGEGVTPLVVLGIIVILGAIALAQLDNRSAEAG